MEETTDGYCTAENVLGTGAWNENAPSLGYVGPHFTMQWHGGLPTRLDQSGETSAASMQQQCNRHYDLFFSQKAPGSVGLQLAPESWAQEQKTLQGCCSACVVGLIGQQGSSKSERRCKNGLTCVSEKNLPGEAGFCVGQGFVGGLRRRAENAVALGG